MLLLKENTPYLNTFLLINPKSIQYIKCDNIMQCVFDRGNVHVSWFYLRTSVHLFARVHMYMLTAEAIGVHSRVLKRNLTHMGLFARVHYMHDIFIMVYHYYGIFIMVYHPPSPNHHHTHITTHTFLSYSYLDRIITLLQAIILNAPQNTL